MWQNFFFQIAMAGAGGIRAMGWNPSDKTGQVTLSGDASRIASVTRSAPFVNQSVRGLTGRSTGKRYFEVTLTEDSPGAIVFGIADATAFHDVFFFGDGNSQGAVLLATYGGTTGAVIPANCSLVAEANAEFIDLGDTSPVEGDVLGFAVDLDQRRLYVSKSGTFYNSADPVTETGYLDFSASPASGVMYPLLQVATAASDLCRVTLNMGDEDFITDPPDDYVAWGKRE